MVGPDCFLQGGEGRVSQQGGELPSHLASHRGTLKIIVVVVVVIVVVVVTCKYIGGP